MLISLLASTVVPKPQSVVAKPLGVTCTASALPLVVTCTVVAKLSDLFLL